MSVGDFAIAAEVSRKTVTQWCKQGRIPAMPIPYGNKITWEIPRYALELTLSRRQHKTKKPKNANIKEHSAYVSTWVKVLRSGSKPFSERTVLDYRRYVSLYLKSNKRVDAKGLKTALHKTKKGQHATREHYYKAVLSFAKYLETKQALTNVTLQEIKALRPLPNPHPKRLVVKDNDIPKLKAQCKDAMEAALLDLMTNTGLRVSEVCNLDWSDLDLTAGELLVRNGKGNKSRKLGLNEQVVSSLQAHSVTMASPGPVFRDRKSQRISISGIQQRIQRMAKDARVEANCHSLRRYFVTSRAAAGKPIALIQKAAGHSSLKTTELYIRIDESTVVQAMREW